MQDARLSCLRRILERMKCEYPLSRFWLIVTQRAVQPDNRITNHYRLWKSLSRQGIGMPPGEFVEHTVNSEQGLRFSGAAQFGLSEVEWAHRIMFRERASVLATYSLEAELAMKGLVEDGRVLQESKPAPELLALCEEHAAAIVNVFGEFDDPDVVVTIVGKKSLIPIGD